MAIIDPPFTYDFDVELYRRELAEEGLRDERFESLYEAGSELNEVYWRLARALGLVEEGDSVYDADPEAILVQVEEELFRIKELEK